MNDTATQPRRTRQWRAAPRDIHAGGGPAAGPVNARPRVRRAPTILLPALCTLLCVWALAGCDLGASSSSSSNSAAGSSGQPVSMPASAQDLQQNIVTVIRTVQPSVVEVISSGGAGEAIGSGDILTKDGYIVTNDHVVEGFRRFAVTLSNGINVPATLVGKDAQDDLAVLRISVGNLQPIAMGDSRKVQVGQFAIAIGSPLGLAQSATFGIVSALNRTASEAPNGPAGTLTGLIQTSAPINPGNSGGALVNLQGQLIGVPTLAAADPQSGTAANGIGFAIPSDRVQFVAQQLIAHGHLVSTGQGFLGVRGTDVTPQLASAYNLPVQSGFLITGFVADASGKSPAQQAGLRTGDIIVAVNSQQIGGNADLASTLVNLAPGTKVTVSFVRGSSKPQQVSVTLGERPVNPQG
jgi:S1-C subfamily serine protease